jgi:hypothetical protein
MITTAQGYYRPTITLDEVRAAKPRMIFYGFITCWWTHDRKHLAVNKSGLPCDPRGGVLLQTDQIEEFLDNAVFSKKNLARYARLNVSHYGRHGLRAFEAAHHLNMRVSVNDKRSTCFTDWEDYNRAIDEYLLHTGKSFAKVLKITQEEIDK